MLRNVGNNYRYMSNHRINGETLEEPAHANDLDESDLRAARAALAKLHACGAAMCDVHRGTSGRVYADCHQTHALAWN